jgi:hypothetical protein
VVTHLNLFVSIVDIPGQWTDRHDDSVRHSRVIAKQLSVIKVQRKYVWVLQYVNTVFLFL